jgi:hypothetical protein
VQPDLTRSTTSNWYNEFISDDHCTRSPHDYRLTPPRPCMHVSINRMQAQDLNGTMCRTGEAASAAIAMGRRLRYATATAISTFLILLGMSPSNQALAAGPPRQLVLELYTSEGCSSCPPAEALVGQLMSDPDLLPLAFHVDYWDAQGWRDKFSLPAATQRQHDWAHHLNGGNVYTPQMIIDGRHIVLGSDGPAVVAALRESLIALQTSQLMVVNATVAEGQVQVEVSGNCNPGSCDTYLVSYLPQANTHVARGENAGHTLVEWNVVRSLQKLDASKAETPDQPTAGTSARWQIAVGTFPADATKLAIVVQDSRSGGVRGARVVDLRG